MTDGFQVYQMIDLKLQLKKYKFLDFKIFLMGKIIDGLDGKALLVILIFTIVETITLSAWLVLLGIPINTGAMAGVGAAIVLFFGLLIEHILAGISNKV